MHDFYTVLGAALAEWLESLTHDHLLLTTVGSNPTQSENSFSACIHLIAAGYYVALFILYNCVGPKPKGQL